MFTGFTTKQVSRLTGLTLGKLRYLSKLGLVEPSRIVLTKKKDLLCYSFTQLLELKAISKLREDVSLITVRKVIDYLANNANNPALASNTFLIYCGEVYHLLDGETFENLLVKITGKNKGQVHHLDLLVLPSINSIKSELETIVKDNPDIIDFEQYRQNAA